LIIAQASALQRKQPDEYHMLQVIETQINILQELAPRQFGRNVRDFVLGYIQ
jgi:hypothetical protein